MRILGVVLAGLVGTTAGAQAVQRAQEPSLVVLITIDGFRADNLEKFGPQLNGGLARLTARGAWFTNAHHDHAITETAPGHATLLSGRFPRSTGIAANRVGVTDAEFPLIGSGSIGASPRRFQGSALFDWIVSRTKSSRVLSVSGKDRGAILPVGGARGSVFWYPGDGTFTTSKYYADSLPAWATRFNARRLPQGFAGKEWTLSRPAAEYSEPDSVNIEGAGNDFVFPHLIPADPQRAANWVRATPFIDELTVAFALEGIAEMKLGSGSQTDLVAVSLSATDAINHRLGPDSRESHDQVLRTDRIIGVFLDSLFKLRDSSRVVVVLSADHGFSPIPELAAQRVNPPPTRVNLEAALAAARAKMTELKVDTAAIDIDEQIVLIDRAAFDRRRGSLESTLEAFRATALMTPGVKRVDRLSALYSKDTLSDPVARRWTHQFRSDTNVELVVTLTPGSLWTDLLVASHGAPYDADSHVPIIFYGPGFKPGRYNAPVRTVDIAPTLARLLRVTPSEKLDGVPLTQALQ